MFSLYVFCAIVGLGLLGLGVLGGEGHADELDLPDGELGGGDASWKKAFSMRAIAYFLAGFGTTGALLSLLGAAAVLTLALASAMGGFAAGFVLLLFGWIRSTEGGFADSSDAYIGAVGRVRVPIRPPVPGSVDVEHGGRVITMRALAPDHASDDPSGWQEVVVVDVDHARGILLVEPLERFLTDGGPPAAASSPS